MTKVMYPNELLSQTDTDRDSYVVSRSRMWTERNKSPCITRENIRSRRDRLDAIIRRGISNVGSKHAINSSNEGYNLAARCRESVGSQRSARRDSPAGQ